MTTPGSGGPGAPGPGEGGAPARGAGWRALRRERMARFRPDYQGLRSSLRRTELFGSLIELFVTALAGVGRMHLGGRDDPAPAGAAPAAAPDAEPATDRRPGDDA